MAAKSNPKKRAGGSLGQLRTKSVTTAAAKTKKLDSTATPTAEAAAVTEPPVRAPLADLTPEQKQNGAATPKLVKMEDVPLVPRDAAAIQPAVVQSERGSYDG